MFKSEVHLVWDIIILFYNVILKDQSFGDATYQVKIVWLFCFISQSGSWWGVIQDESWILLW